VEFFHHLWEVGARKAKEMLFTSDALSAQEAQQLGMVNQVVPREELAEAALVMARKIAAKSRFALKLTKKAINGAQDAQGRKLAMQNAFHLHQLAHTHWLKLYDFLMDPTGLPEATRKALGVRLNED
jgi:enoyl-CoA hydratase